MTVTFTSIIIFLSIAYSRIVLYFVIFVCITKKRITSKNVIDATKVPSELGYEYEM